MHLREQGVGLLASPNLRERVRVQAGGPLVVVLRRPAR